LTSSTVHRTGEPLKVLLVDDHKLFSESLGTVLGRDELVVVGIATTGREAVSLASEEAPDVCLVDLQLPDSSGIEVGKQILKLDPEIAVLAVTAHTDPQLVQETLAAGFRGYLIKDMPLSHFVGAIKAVLAGQIVMPQRLAHPVIGSRTPEEEHAALLRGQFTRRERDVLILLSKGFTSQRIAQELSVTNNTVRTHIQNILTKLQAHSRLEAVALAIRYGIIAPREDEHRNL
jgi:DNA-binding NarL/FixJ family response regulator